MMSRAEMVSLASDHFGKRVPAYVLSYAVEVGAVDRPEKRSGWFMFSQHEYEQFLHYLETRSRLGLSSPARQH